MHSHSPSRSDTLSRSLSLARSSAFLALRSLLSSMLSPGSSLSTTKKCERSSSAWITCSMVGIVSSTISAWSMVVLLFLAGDADFAPALVAIALLGAMWLLYFFNLWDRPRSVADHALPGGLHANIGGEGPWRPAVALGEQGVAVGPRDGEPQDQLDEVV